MEQIKVRNVIGDPIKFTIGDGVSIDEIIKASEIPEQLLPQIVVLNHGLMIKEWSYITHPGDQLTICVRPSGGGGGGGKGVLGAIASIAVVVAAIVLAAPTGGASLWLAGATGFSAATASAILTVGFTMVGMMAVNALIPPPSQNGQNGLGDSSSYQESQGYSLSGQSNAVKVYQPIPIVYGTYKVYPNVCVTPRVQTLGKVSNIAIVYDYGLGDLDVTDIRIGDQPAGELGAQIEIFQNTKTPDFKHIDNLQALDQFAYVLSANAVTVRTKPGTNSASVVLSLGRGLCYYNNSGNPENASFTITAEYRPVGGSTWTPIRASSVRRDGISVDDVTTGGAVVNQYLCDEGQTATVPANSRVKYDGIGGPHVIGTVSGTFTCNNATFGDPAPGYYKVCSLVGTPVTYTNELKITGATTRPNIFNIDLTFSTAGEYEVRITRSGAASTDNRTVNDLQLAQIKSFKVGEVVKLDHKHTMIEFYAQGSDKLTGVVQNLSSICYKKIRYCDSSGWNGYGRTSNPAFIALDILTHEANPQPLADAQIDFASFKRLADICDTDVTRTINGQSVTFKRFEFNGMLDQAMTVQEAVNNVLINARAQLCVMQSGKFGVFIDEVKTTPKQLITPANSWNFSGNRNFPDYPDALRVSFVEPNLQWGRGEIIVYADGKDATNAEKFEQLELNGITSYAQAWSQGRFYMAEGRFRSELFSVTMDVENLVVIRGDLVSVQHDVPKMGGLACRVVSNVAGVVTLDQDFVLPNNAGYTVRLLDGTIKTGSITSSTGKTVTLATPDPSIDFDDLFVIGERDKVTRDYLVMAVEPSNDLTATLTLCPYVPGVYTADQGAIPDWDPGFGQDVLTGTDLAVANVTYTQTINHQNRLPFADIKLTWTTTGNLGTLKHYNIYGTLPDGTRQLLGTTDGATFNWNLDLLAHKDWWNKNIKYEVIPVNTIGTSGTSATTTHTLVPDQETPLDPTGYGVNIIDNSLVEIFWHKSRASDIAYYEVRYSPEVINAVWGASQKLATVSWDTTRTTAGARTGTYMLQAVDTSGNRGNVLSLRTSVENLPKLDLLHIVDESATWPGTLTDMNMSLGEPTIDGAFGAVKNRGVYNYKEIFDAGSIDELRFQSKIKGYGVTADDFMVKWVPLSIATPLAKATSSDYDIWLEVATADDYDVMSSTRWNPLSNVIPLGMAGFNWKPWRRVESVDLTGRFFKFRIIAESYNPNVNVRLVSSIVEIDVLERIIAQNDLQVTNAAGGLLVSFNPPFRTTPALAINVDGNTKAINYELVSKSNSQAVVRLIDITTGTPTTGQIDVSALGWGKIRTSSL